LTGAEALVTVTRSYTSRPIEVHINGCCVTSEIARR